MTSQSKSKMNGISKGKFETPINNKGVHRVKIDLYDDKSSGYSSDPNSHKRIRNNDIKQVMFYSNETGSQSVNNFDISRNSMNNLNNGRPKGILRNNSLNPNDPATHSFSSLQNT